MNHINIIIRLLKLYISIIFYIFDSFFNKLSKLSNFDKRSKSFTRTRITVIYYHGITTIQKNRFIRQMNILKRLSTPVSFKDINNKNLIQIKNPVIVTFDDAFISILENALPEMKKHDIPAIIFAPAGCLGNKPPWIKDPDNPDINDRVMNTEELNKIDSGLFTIGSHCLMHNNLLLLNKNDGKAEIFKSKEILENALKFNIESISFPHGKYNTSHVKQSGEAGYKWIFSIFPEEWLLSKKNDAIGRFKVEPEDWYTEFRFKILGAYRWLGLIKKLKRK